MLPVDFTYIDDGSAKSWKNDYGLGGHSKVKNTPAKLLVERSDGFLEPCDYRSAWFDYSDPDGSSLNTSRREFVASGKRPIAPNSLVEVTRVYHEGGLPSFPYFPDHFAVKLMECPPKGVKFIRYLGIEKREVPQEPKKFLWLKIARPSQEKSFHVFSCCSGDLAKKN